jgi:hypothetical protein
MKSHVLVTSWCRLVCVYSEDALGPKFLDEGDAGGFILDKHPGGVVELPLLHDRSLEVRVV